MIRVWGGLRLDCPAWKRWWFMDFRGCSSGDAKLSPVTFHILQEKDPPRSQSYIHSADFKEVREWIVKRWWDILSEITPRLLFTIDAATLVCGVLLTVTETKTAGTIQILLIGSRLFASPTTDGTVSWPPNHRTACSRLNNRDRLHLTLTLNLNLNLNPGVVHIVFGHLDSCPRCKMLPYPSKLSNP